MTTLALLLLPLLALGGSVGAAVTRSRGVTRDVAESLPIDNGVDRGEWGPTELCDANSYASAFEIKYSGLGFLDDTSVNAIRLFCQTAAGVLTNVVMSSEGSYGQWKGMRSCPLGEFLMGVRANVVPDQGTLGDDLGMDNLQMRCSKGNVLDGLYGTPAKEDQNPVVARELTRIGKRDVEAVFMKVKQSAHTRDFGDWGLWRACSAGNKVCGLQVRLEDDHLLDDDAGVTDVVVFCCT